MLVLLLGLTISSAQSATRAQSCFAAGSGAQSISSLPVPSNNPANSSWLGEASRMNRCMGTTAALHYSDTLDNALADPNKNIVVLGTPLLRRAEREGPTTVSLGMGFLLAHEYSHHFQFRSVRQQLDKLGNVTPITEMQADILAGYWAGARIKEQSFQSGLGSAWEVANRSEFVRLASTFGDYAYWSAGHHGTPAQRAAAVQIGFDAGHGQTYGSLESAYSTNAAKLFDWSKKAATEIHAPSLLDRTW
jgi:hypothetical protein